MRPEQLQRIQACAHVDVVAAFHAYHQHTGSADAQEFLAYLRYCGCISQETLQALLAEMGGGYAAGGQSASSSAGSSPSAGSPDGSNGQRAAPAPTSEPIAGRYQVLGALGEGGMGTVRLVRDQVLGRRIALKELRRDADLPPGSAARFRDEARVTAQLDHPGIVSVHDLTVTRDGSMAMTMKRVEGETLEELIATCRRRLEAGEELPEPLRLPRRLDRFIKVCEAVAFAHERGVLHRDLKPANIMVGRWGEVYVMDWGLARVMGNDGTRSVVGRGVAESDLSRHTLDGQVVGTPAYMAPEQAEGDNGLDGRADLYALGLILYELACLRTAKLGGSAVEMMANTMLGHRRPIAPFSRKEKVPRELAAIIDRATAHERDQRYATVGELADDVRRYLRGEGVAARPDSPPQRLARWLARHREATLGALVAVLLLCAGVFAWALSEQLAAQQREERLGRFHTAVAERGHRIDSHFRAYQSRLEELAAVALQALEHGRPAEEPGYSDVDFDTPGQGPPDLTDSPLYGKPVSLDWPVYRLAPGIELEAVRPQIARLYTLRAAFRRLLASSDPDRPAPAARDAVRARLLEAGAPIRWAYVGLESGVMFAYPGKGDYPPEYDPRLRPWYALGRDGRGARWGSPYIDVQDQGLILPCVAPLRDAYGSLLGVAGVEVTFEHIIDALLTFEGEPAIQEAFLIDGEGRIVIRSSERADRPEGGRLYPARPLEPFAPDAVVKAARGGRSGLLELPADSGRSLFAYLALPTLGWTYVVQADLEALLGSGSPR